MKKIKVLLLMLVAMLAFSITVTIAQAPPFDPNDPDGPGGFTGIPVDGGISALLATGVALGVKKLKQA